MTADADNGLEVMTILGNAAFEARPVKARAGYARIEGMQRIGAALVERPDTILQELVNAAVDLCGATALASALKRQTARTRAFTIGSRRRESTRAFWMRSSRVTRVHAEFAWIAANPRCFA